MKRLPPKTWDHLADLGRYRPRAGPPAGRGQALVESAIVLALLCLLLHSSFTLLDALRERLALRYALFFAGRQDFVAPSWQTLPHPSLDLAATARPQSLVLRATRSAQRALERALGTDRASHLNTTAAVHHDNRGRRLEIKLLPTAWRDTFNLPEPAP